MRAEALQRFPLRAARHAEPLKDDELRSQLDVGLPADALKDLGVVALSVNDEPDELMTGNVLPPQHAHHRQARHLYLFDE